MNIKKLLQYVTNTVKRLLGRIPSKLPTGYADFEAFASGILDTYSIPNNPSYYHAIATMIMHLGPTVDKAPKHYFAKSVRKAMSNQVAYAAIQKLKEEEKQSVGETTDDQPVQN